MRIKMKIPFIFSLILYFLASCSLGDGKDYSYQDTMNVIYEYNKKLSKEHSIELSMYGLEYAGEDKIYDGKIHMINLGYAVDKRIQYKEARMLFYELIDNLLQKINNTEYLRKYFFTFPVRYEDVYIHLSFDYYDKGILKKGDISSAYLYDNTVCFSTIEVEEPDEIKQKKVIPGVFILEELLSKKSFIEENPYTKEIICRRPCPMSSKSIENIQLERND